MQPEHNLTRLITYPNGGITSRVIFKSERLNVTLFCMAAGTDIGEHTSTKEGTVQVIEGEGTFTLAAKPIRMMPGTLIHITANQPHDIRAKKNTAFLLTLVG